MQRSVEHHRCEGNAQSTVIPCCIGTLTIRHKRNLKTRKLKEEAHVAALSVSEQVLLMTCKVKVTAPNGSSTIARALIDPGSSTSFVHVHERIAQLVHLPRIKKNVMVEGVGGTTTPTRGSVWFQVSGVEDDAEKIGAIRAQESHKGPISASYPTCPQMGPHFSI